MKSKIIEEKNKYQVDIRRSLIDEEERRRKLFMLFKWDIIKKKVIISTLILE